MTSPGALVEDAIRTLESAGVVYARREAEWLLETASGLSRAEIVTEGARVDEATVRRLDRLVARRAAGEPLQYVTGVAGFRRLELAVGP
ncbi:MAG TPA: peptide chain release factor N(5)-glutamine methyltransferase, partial [Actinomycetota bacterium]